MKERERTMSDNLKNLYDRKEKLEKKIEELEFLQVKHHLLGEEGMKHQQELVSLKHELNGVIIKINSAFDKVKVREEKYRK